MKVELDLNFIKKTAVIKEDENFRFRSYLKGQDGDKVDRIVHELYAKVLEKVDCTECGNCCKELETCFEKDEIVRLTRELNINTVEFIEQSTNHGDFDEKDKFYLNSIPCQFLKDNKCTVYALRPEECNSYPYLHKDNFISRLFGVIENYEICPIVYNVYELLKRRLNFR